MGLEHLYNISVNIIRPAITQGSYMEQVRSDATVATNTRGRLQRQKKIDPERVFSGKDVVWSDYVFYCDDSVDVQATDVLKYVDAEGVTRSFDIRAVDNSNQMDVYKRVELLEIR